jgi:hypothetical protein
MKFLRVRGTSKRCREPIVLDIGKFRLLLDELQGPFPARWSFSISPHVSAAASYSRCSGATCCGRKERSRAQRNRDRSGKRCKHQILQCRHAARSCIGRGAPALAREVALPRPPRTGFLRARSRRASCPGIPGESNGVISAVEKRDESWWSRWDSNPRPPRCHRGALPTAPRPHRTEMLSPIL